jgi:hypothetical protein
VLIIALALVQSVLYGWALGIERGEEEAHLGAHMRIPHFVQLMLKYVVPVYLIAIFGMFCWNNVPSHDKDVATAPNVTLADLDAGPVPEAIRSALPATEESLPAEAVIEPTKDNEFWEVRAEEGPPLYRVSSDENGLRIYTHAAGYFENTINDKNALGSIAFISVVAIFLLLLVHIAGKRWEKDGRLSYD